MTILGHSEGTRQAQSISCIGAGIHPALEVWSVIQELADGGMSDIFLKKGYLVNCYSFRVAPPKAGHRGIKPLLHILILSVGRICPANGGAIRQSIFLEFCPKVLKDISALLTFMTFVLFSPVKRNLKIAATNSSFPPSL
jgi:hypothetical protein